MQSEPPKLDGLINRDGLVGSLSISPLRMFRYVGQQSQLYSEHGPDDAGYPRAFFDAAQIVIANGDLAGSGFLLSGQYLDKLSSEGDDSSRELLNRALSQHPSPRYMERRWSRRVPWMSGSNMKGEREVVA
jgi:hypothetical protein